jgi:hypothetical protein
MTIMTTAEKVAKAVNDFIQGGDNQNITILDQVLHPQFRSMVNRFAGKSELTVIPKERYLQLISEHKIGGAARTIAELEVEIAGPVALAKVQMQSEKVQFISFYELVENEDNAWQLVSDLPYATLK